MRKYTDLGIELGELIKENALQKEKWGIRTHTLYKWFIILSEEVGELSKAILENECGDWDINEVQKEAVQVATVAAKIAQMVKGGE